MKQRDVLTRPQRILVGTVCAGAVVIAGIGFAGSYTAVQQLAARKGFGDFAHWFPIGLDAGIVVLLALDLLLTWLRIPYPPLRPTAWLLTAATIAFNGATSWPDPIGVGMHAVIPVLFVVAIEAARNAIGRLADITADRYVEPVPLRRWLLAPPSTFRLWRRMQMWQIRTLDEALALERERLEYVDRLRAKYGRGWRRKAPVEAMLPLRRTRYGKSIRNAIKADSVICAGPGGVLTVALPAAPTARPVERAASAPEVTLERRPAPTAPAPAPALERPATNVESAPAPGRPGDDAPAKAPRKKPAAPDGAPARSQVKQRIRALYDDLDRRPLEGEMVDVLRKARTEGYPYDSRQHANKLRREIEKQEPKLAERGSDNVRALTGT